MTDCYLQPCGNEVQQFLDFLKAIINISSIDHYTSWNMWLEKLSNTTPWKSHWKYWGGRVSYKANKKYEA